MIYSNEISEIINIKQKSKEFSFELFLNSFLIDFDIMNQRNQISNYNRAILKEPKTNNDEKESIIKVKEIILLKYDKANVYNEERTVYSTLPAIEISIFSKKNAEIEPQQKLKAIEVQKEIETMLKENFEVYKKIIPSHLTAKRIEVLTDFCSRERIYLSEELASGKNMLVVGYKESLEKFEELIQKDDYPWDSSNSDFELIDLKPDDPEYQTVNTSFKATMQNKMIVSIKRIQNNELYLQYQQTVQKAKRDKRKEGRVITDDEFEKYEKFLWHGTSTADPALLVDNTKSCLSTQYANDSCLWGRGIYFAENASYSDAYSFRKIDGKTQSLIIVRFLSGKA